MLAQGRFAPCQGQGCPSYESPRKPCSPHKEGMFWNLEGLAATGIQEARSPAQQEGPPTPGLACEGGNAVLQPGAGSRGRDSLTWSLQGRLPGGGSFSVPALSHRVRKSKDYRISSP